MEHSPFKLESDFAPSGDQPKAIDKLVEGVNDGLAHQTLLGVTGSGKSVGFDEPLLIGELKSGRWSVRYVKAGSFIDSLMKADGLDDGSGAETERYATADRAFFTPAYDPQRGTAAWFPVAALLRHRAPARMFRLSTECGREISVTGDHNFWVLRDGKPTLIKTQEALDTDYLPVPETITGLADETPTPRSRHFGVAGTGGAAVRAEQAIDVTEMSVHSGGLPRFWPQGSDEALGGVLRTFFDRAATLGTGGELTLTTLDDDLASQLAYALKRFGIHARLQRARLQRGMNQSVVLISDTSDLRLFARYVGSDNPGRMSLLRSSLERADDAGDTLVAISGGDRGSRVRNGVRWTRIRSVAPIEYAHAHVYDLSVPGPETFLAGHGGVFVHNTYSIAQVIQRVQRPTMVLAHNKTLAAQLYGEFREFFPHNSVEYFVSYYDYYQPEAYVPSSDTYIEKDSSVNEHIEQMRLSATKALLERPDSIIVATVSSIYGLGDPQAYLSMILHLVRGDKTDQRRLLRRLADMQYTRNELDLTQGTYRVRGDVIDIFPAESEREAVRVELFDDQIDSLSLFDPLTGEISRRVPRFTVYPGTHYVTPRERLIGAVDQVREDLRLRLKELRDNGKLLEAQRLEQRTMFDMEMMKEVGYCAGIENYSRYLSGRQPGEPPPCLFDYLPRNSLLVIDESHQTIPQLGAMYRGDRSRKEVLVEYGFRLPSALDNRPLKFEEWEKLAPQMIFVSATPGKYEAEHSAQVVEQLVRPTGLVDPEVEVRPVGTQVDDVLSEINKRVALNERVLITTLTKRMAEDLTEYLHEHGVRVRYLHADIETVERTEIIRDLRLGKFDVLVGINLLREGLDMPEVSLVAILDADKEGFLRSDNSLIQTIGRAARHINGRAILYADRITGSMERALEETNRRRKRQMEFNIEHGITPRGIQKSVADIMEGARATAPSPLGRKRGGKGEALSAADLRPENLVRQIKKLEAEMFKRARNLEFEQAAKLRDEVERLKQLELGFPSPVRESPGEGAGQGANKVPAAARGGRPPR